MGIAHSRRFRNSYKHTAENCSFIGNGPQEASDELMNTRVETEKGADSGAEPLDAGGAGAAGVSVEGGHECDDRQGMLEVRGNADAEEQAQQEAHDAPLPQQAVTAGSTGGGRIGGGGSFLRRFGGTGEPLTTALLSAAYKEVPSGAEKTIEHVIDCWRTSKLRGLSHGCWQLDLPSWGINMKK